MATIQYMPNRGGHYGEEIQGSHRIHAMDDYGNGYKEIHVPGVGTSYKYQMANGQQVLIMKMDDGTGYIEITHPNGRKERKGLPPVLPDAKQTSAARLSLGQNRYPGVNGPFQPGSYHTHTQTFADGTTLSESKSFQPGATASMASITNPVMDINHTLGLATIS